MSGEASRQIDQALFEAALGIGDADARREFLAVACTGNPDRLARVTGWLDTRASAEKFFHTATIARAQVGGEVAASLERDTPPVRDLDHDHATTIVEHAEAPGSRIGRYHLLERIGEGGCGLVYLAEQLEPVRRRVALKVIRSELDSAGVMARFESERQTLALMDHPGIARVFDAGSTSEGKPYFVMELVSGEKITAHCDAQRLGVRERLELFILVCQAIQHAHQKGIIHRDIKPSNVLVSCLDGTPVPKVIDFGIARAVEGRVGDQTYATAVGQLIGTPAYMSPEQAEGGQAPDTRGDVYSLGALLYELFTGAPPFDGKRLTQIGLFEMLRILREEEPPVLSEMLGQLTPKQLAAVAAARDTTPSALLAAVRGDLDWIVAKAMAKDRRGRYDTVNGLAVDLRRFLDDEAVIARPPGKLYLLHKLIRRHRFAFTAAAMVTVVLTVGLATSSWFYLREREARQQQVLLREAAETARTNEARMLHQSKARESVSQAAMLLAEGKIEEADALLLQTPPGSIEPSLEAANVLRTLAEWNAIRQRWQQAADCYLLFLQANQRGRFLELEFGLWIPLSIGPTLLEANRHDDYERFRHEAIGRHGEVTDPMARVNLLRTCLLRPADDALLAQLRPHVEPLRTLIAEKELRTGKAGWGSCALALMAWRSGDPAEALLRSRESIASSIPNPPRIAACHALAAMAAHCLGQVEPAQVHLAEARSLQARLFNPDAHYPRGNANGHWVDWTIARLLEREAGALMESVGDEVR
jgi:eukaryotic-like serine/threonine-protein kinase